MKRLFIDDSIGRLASLSPAKKNLIVTDREVRRLHGRNFPAWPVIEIGRGESSKTLATVEALYEEFLKHEIDRSSCIVAIGGGIVCDVAGFAASTFMRGLPFGSVPTTLLAQVDASVGGKNGVNFKGYKNLVGTFTQPSFVLCDFSVLKTLPEDERKNGFAEAIKHGAMGDARLFAYLEKNTEKAFAFAPEALQRIVGDSIVLKSGIVQRDEREKGERRKLNFGHTIGHALEKSACLAHGQAVSIGMAVASSLSVAKRLLSAAESHRIERLLRAFGLPVAMPVRVDALMDALAKDKKRENGIIHFVLLERIGKSVTMPVRFSELREVLSEVRDPLHD